MNKYIGKAKELVSQMTLEEKAGLCSGRDVWHTKPVERIGVGSVMVSDGPHGLRKQMNTQDNLGIGDSVPATCFPTASLTACSFDPELLGEMGKGIAEECIAESVDVVLGPGVNMKRSPLCGRNFEYFSEDPYLAGKLAAGYINGVQSQGVGTSLKHFAANNQEKRRMSIDAQVDERTLNEYYLKAFEIAVKESQPRSVMCSYNKVNGKYSSENKWLLTETLREKWGFDGLVVSDWGATHLRPSGVESGLDLEMPGSMGINDSEIIKAVQEGSLLEEQLDLAAARVVAFALEAEDAKRHQNVSTGENVAPNENAASSESDSLNENAAPNKSTTLNRNVAFNTANGMGSKEHHSLAVRIAEESMVLLKNDTGLLPLKNGQKVAVIGPFAESPRFQGAGSSKITPIQVDNPLDALKALGVNAKLVAGWDEIVDEKSIVRGAAKKAEEKLDAASLRSYFKCDIDEIAEKCADSDIVIFYGGLPERSESEGFDRSHMRLPDEQNYLIEAIARKNANLVVVLMGGSPMELPWESYAKGILLAYLGGEGTGAAIANILSGKVSPSGKLAETWPFHAQDCLSSRYFPGDRAHVQHRESVFCGYRYFDTVNKPVQYKFGHGLSYSSFRYVSTEAPAMVADGDKFNVTVTIENTGDVVAKEICMVFATQKDVTDFRPKRQLAGFEKVEIAPRTSAEAVIEIDTRELGVYDIEQGKFTARPGEYILTIGGSLDNLPLELGMCVDSRPRHLGTDNDVTLSAAAGGEATSDAKVLMQGVAFNEYHATASGDAVAATGGEFVGATDGELAGATGGEFASAASGKAMRRLPDAYMLITEGVAVDAIPAEDFEKLLGRELSPEVTRITRPFTMDNCLEDTDSTRIGRFILWIISKVVKQMSKAEENQDQMMEAAVKEMPFFALRTSAAGMVGPYMFEGILDVLNGHFFKGIGKMLKRK